MALTKLKLGKKKVADQVEVNEVETVEEETEVVKPKKTLGKLKTKVKEPEEVVIEESDGDEGDEYLFEDEEEIVEEKPAKEVKEKAVKAAPKTTKAGSTLFSAPTVRKTGEKRLLTEGVTITRDEWTNMFAAKHGIPAGEFRKLMLKLEQFIEEEVFPKYNVNLFGALFKRSTTKTKLHSGVGGLKVKDSGLTTMVPPYTKVSATVHIGRQSIRGIMNEDGEFISGKYDSNGEFVEGTWGNTKDGHINPDVFEYTE